MITMKLEITENEQPLLVSAIDQSIASAKRSQTSGKTPQIKQVYQQHESVLQALKAKVLAAK